MRLIILTILFQVDLSKEQPFSAALVKTVLDTSRPLSITSSPKISNEDRTIRKESLKSNAQPQIVFQNLKKPSTPPRREEQKGPSELASMFRKMHSRPANERIFNGGIRDSNEENRGTDSNVLLLLWKHVMYN